MNLFKPDAWIITGGLNRGVDQLIGDEVKQRLENRDKIPLAVLGINHWGRLAEKEKLLNVKYSILLTALIACKKMKHQISN